MWNDLPKSSNDVTDSHDASDSDKYIESEEEFLTRIKRTLPLKESSSDDSNDEDSTT